MIYALIAIVALLTAVQILIRTNAAVVFFAVCAGSVLLAAMGADTDLLAHSMGKSSSISTETMQAIVVLLPAVVSAIFLRKRVPKTKTVLIIIPALCASIVALTLVYPFLGISVKETLSSGKGWTLLAENYDFIVVVGIFTSMFTLGLTIPKHKEDKHHKKGKHH